jgi:hypothetical protein
VDFRQIFTRNVLHFRESGKSIFVQLQSQPKLSMTKQLATVNYRLKEKLRMSKKFSDHKRLIKSSRVGGTSTWIKQQHAESKEDDAFLLSLELAHAPPPSNATPGSKNRHNGYLPLLFHSLSLSVWQVEVRLH